MLSSLSQSHLALLATCPRKFQHIYLDRVTVPKSWHQYQRILWGTQFHQLMQQMELGLPIEGFEATQPELYQGILALRSANPQVFQAPDPARGEWRSSEHRRSLAFAVPGGDPVGLVVVYDWVRGDPQFAEILDWKTYRQPPQGENLAQSWQTRLYCYVLVQTSHYEPEQIQFTYWFIAPPRSGSVTTTAGSREAVESGQSAQSRKPAESAQSGQLATSAESAQSSNLAESAESGQLAASAQSGQSRELAESGKPAASAQSTGNQQPQPRSVSFTYDRAQHEAIHRDLSQLIQKFQTWTAAYQQQGQPFPQVPEGDRACEFCGFQQRCQRGLETMAVSLAWGDPTLPAVQAQLQELVQFEEIPAIEPS
ncbi:MAG: PD-(D/E)XK nuclease family protein, partial [Prochlorothrix sp.]|nr:PD-(D/E)XK nuclease family protein [Prochlorothrix sp.]